MPDPLAQTTNHRAIAELLGLSIPTISRLRSGERVPSWPNQQVIAERLNWPLADQTRARERSRWYIEFERHIRIWADQQPLMSDSGFDAPTPKEV